MTNRGCKVFNFIVFVKDGNIVVASGLRRVSKDATKLSLEADRLVDFLLSRLVQPSKVGEQFAVGKWRMVCLVGRSLDRGDNRILYKVAVINFPLLCDFGCFGNGCWFAFVGTEAASPASNNPIAVRYFDLDDGVVHTS